MTLIHPIKEGQDLALHKRDPPSVQRKVLSLWLAALSDSKRFSSIIPSLTLDFSGAVMGSRVLYLPKYR